MLMYIYGSTVLTFKTYGPDVFFGSICPDMENLQLKEGVLFYESIQ